MTLNLLVCCKVQQHENQIKLQISQGVGHLVNPVLADLGGSQICLSTFVATCSYRSYYLLSRNQLKAAIASAYDNGEKVKSLADQALIGEVKTAEDWISEIDAVTTADVTNVRLL